MRCHLCNIEWDEKENPDFYKKHQLTELHLANSKHRAMRIRARKERHSRMSQNGENQL